jgi:hypothetical protein
MKEPVDTDAAAFSAAQRCLRLTDDAARGVDPRIALLFRHQFTVRTPPVSYLGSSRIGIGLIHKQVVVFVPAARRGKLELAVRYCQ